MQRDPVREAQVYRRSSAYRSAFHRPAAHIAKGVRAIAGLRALLFSRRDAYREALGARAARICLADLHRFCHAQHTTHVVGDPYGSAQLEGRRQVWLRIEGYLRMTPEHLRQRVVRGYEEDEG